MPRGPIPTWCFALVVVRRGERFLVVHERAEVGGWWLPGGRLEPGEGFPAAAVREALEESGVPVRLTGLLRVEHTPGPDHARLRVVFLAEPVDDTPPKQVADAESLEARWVTLAELERLPLRGPDVLRLFRAVAAGAPVFPLGLLGAEGGP